MITPQQYIELHKSAFGDSPITDADIERIADQCLTDASGSQEIVFVAFDDPATAKRCQEIYSAHYKCEVDGRGTTVEIRVPRIGARSSVSASAVMPDIATRMCHCHPGREVRGCPNEGCAGHSKR
jgi:hypothetical protein